MSALVRRLIIFFFFVCGTLAALAGPAAFIFGDRFMFLKLALFLCLFVFWRHGYSI